MSWGTRDDERMPRQMSTETKARSRMRPWEGRWVSGGACDHWCPVDLIAGSPKYWPTSLLCTLAGLGHKKRSLVLS